jgi:hypothetical protein
MIDPLDLLIPTVYELINFCAHARTRTVGPELTCDDCGDVLLNLESEREHAEDNLCQAKLHPFGHEDY